MKCITDLLLLLQIDASEELSLLCLFALHLFFLSFLWFFFQHLLRFFLFEEGFWRENGRISTN